MTTAIKITVSYRMWELASAVAAKYEVVSAADTDVLDKDGGDN